MIRGVYFTIDPLHYNIPLSLPIPYPTTYKIHFSLWLQNKSSFGGREKIGCERENEKKKMMKPYEVEKDIGRGMKFMKCRQFPMAADSGC